MKRFGSIAFPTEVGKAAEVPSVTAVDGEVPKSVHFDVRSVYYWKNNEEYDASFMCGICMGTLMSPHHLLQRPSQNMSKPNWSAVGPQ